MKRKKLEESKFVIYAKNMAVEISHWLVLAGISPHKRSGLFGRFFLFIYLFIYFFYSFFVQTSSTLLTGWRPGIPDSGRGCYLS